MLTIEGVEAVTLAEELSSLLKTSPQDAVLRTLKERVEKERALRAKVDDVRKLAAEIRSLMDHPLPTSDMSRFYDNETGLPI